MSVTKSMRVSDIDLILSWDEATGAVATLPTATFTRDTLEELRSAAPQIDDALQTFNAEQRLVPFDLAAHGMRHHSALGFEGVAQPPLRTPFGFWIAGDVDEVDLGTPCVTALISSQFDEHGNLSEAIFWHLGNFGFPAETGTHVNIDLPHDEVMQAIVRHLRQDADAAQVGIYLEAPEALGEARYLWDAEAAERDFEETVTKSDHVPYTRVKRIAREALNNYASVHVYAFDVETEQFGCVTPAVAVDIYGSGAEVIRQALVNDGLTAIEPIFLDNEQTGARAWHRRNKTVFVKNADRFAGEEARKWLGRLVDRTHMYGSRVEFRSA